MAITVPKNPFSINVVIGSTENMGGLQAAPKTEFSQDALAQSVVERFDKFSQTVDKWQSELDQVRAKDLITQLEEKRLDLRYNKDSGYQTLLGINALERPDGKSLTDEVSANFKEIYDAIRLKAGNPRQRAALDAYFQDASAKLRSDVGSWEFKQAQVYQVDQAQAQFRLGMTQALSDDPELQASGEAVVRDAALTVARISGKTVDMAKYMGPIHAMRISKMVDDLSPTEAKAYLSAHRDEMSADQIAQADKYVRAGLQDQKEKRIAASILKSANSESEALKAVAGQDEKSRAGVERIVKKHYALEDAIKKERLSEITDAVWNFVADKVSKGEEVTIPTTLMEDLRELDPKGYLSLNTYIGKLERGESVKTDMTTWGMLERMSAQDPERFANLNLNSFADRISPTDLKGLKRTQEQLSNEDRKAYLSDVKSLVKANKKLKARWPEVLNAAGEWFDYQAQQYQKGVIPRDVLERGKAGIVSRLEGSGWFSDDPYAFEAINSGAVTDIASGLFRGAYKASGSDADNKTFVLKKFGIQLDSLSKEQKAVADALRRGYGWPPEVMAQALRELEKHRKASKYVSNAQITNEDISNMCAAIIFQNTQKAK
ncbi:hypothetical protein [Sutterella wadsworthensis]|jgi:hypothetical protein|uniref:hypothetical protein n=1 Tax=Sutterella wadsworthensis TaxID=40545 RepID=UPI0026671576|nr:hypothetical protein [Sutterella wadsworthensis]